jgi:hypothetical protein
MNLIAKRLHHPDLALRIEPDADLRRDPHRSTP